MVFGGNVDHFHDFRCFGFVYSVVYWLLPARQPGTVGCYKLAQVENNRRLGVVLKRSVTKILLNDDATDLSSDCRRVVTILPGLEHGHLIEILSAEKSSFLRRNFCVGFRIEDFENLASRS